MPRRHDVAQRREGRIQADPGRAAAAAVRELRDPSPGRRRAAGPKPAAEDPPSLPGPSLHLLETNGRTRHPHEPRRPDGVGVVDVRTGQGSRAGEELVVHHSDHVVAVTVELHRHPGSDESEELAGRGRGGPRVEQEVEAGHLDRLRTGPLPHVVNRRDPGWGEPGQATVHQARRGDRGALLVHRGDERDIPARREVEPHEPRSPWLVLTHSARGSACIHTPSCFLAREAAQRALALSENVAKAWAALGVISLYFDWEFETAKQLLERAVASSRATPASGTRTPTISW